MTAPTHCTCMSGLTDGEAKLLELRGMIEAVEWKVCEAIAAHSGPAPVGNPEVVTYLERLRLGLVRAEDFCRVHGWRRGPD